MITRKIIKYEFLVEYYKEHKDRPPDLISRQADFCYNKEITVEIALKTAKDINSSKKKLLRVTGYNDKDLYGIDADAHSAAWVRRDIYETLNKWLEKCDYVHMTFLYADNKTVELSINKTKHNHHYV